MSADQDSDATVEHATDPTLVRTVVEERDGFPAHLAGSEGEGDSGLLRVGFPDIDEDFEEISWEQFREEFEEKDLAAAYAADPEGTIDGTHPVRLVEREEVQDEDDA